MSLPIKFRKSRENITSYNFLDVATGTGILVMYAGITSSGARLNNYAFYSERVGTVGGLSSGVWKIMNSLDFDVNLTNNFIMEGETIINVPHGILGATSTMDYRSYVDAIIKRIRDGEVKTVTSQSGSSIRVEPVGQWNYIKGISAINIDIPKTNFKNGDILRLTINQYGKEVDNIPAASGIWFIGHDPKNRDTSGNEQIVSGSASYLTFGGDPSQLTFPVPVRIDL